MDIKEYQDLLQEIAESTPEGRKAIAERLADQTDDRLDEAPRHQTWRDRPAML
jgi:hypothetical protein